jgi:hypothetical protein
LAGICCGRACSKQHAAIGVGNISLNTNDAGMISLITKLTLSSH